MLELTSGGDGIQRCEVAKMGLHCADEHMTSYCGWWFSTFHGGDYRKMHRVLGTRTICQHCYGNNRGREHNSVIIGCGMQSYTLFLMQKVLWLKEICVGSLQLFKL